MSKFSHKSLIGTCLLASALMLGACTDNPPAPREVSVIPTLNHLEETPGAFILKRQTTIGYTDPSLEPAAQYLAGLLQTSKVKEGEADITLSLGEVKGQEGGYRLHSTTERMEITGNSYAGVIAGISTLRQLLPPEIETHSPGTWAIPTVDIEDAPRYEWRGIMLDVSRHFYTKEEVKQLLDVMALYKMNKFHWHLTDDQGWRIEIKQYPLLTEKGAWRKFNSQDKECLRLAEKQDNPDYLLPADRIRVVEGDTLYGGFYTQEDIKDVIAYAGVRGIDVVPEIDMPGHMLAAVSNYAGVSCFDETGWGNTFSSPVCPGKDSALEFCRNVYSELVELFPYTYIHIGGDEVEKTNWKKCPDCQKRMHDEGLKTEEELQAWFIHHMEHFFNEHGKKMIGWDEIIEGGLSETATVMWWRSWAKNAGTRTTGQGNQLIYTPNSHFYLDYQEDKNSVPGIFAFDPANGLTAEQHALVKGVQGNIWCEWIPSKERMHYMAIPRLIAIAELGWAKAEGKNSEDFRQRLAGQFERLNLMDINYRIPDLEGFHAINTFIGEGSVNVTCLDPTAEIHYTTDGSTPTLQSPRYDGPLTISETTDFTFRTFRPSGKNGDIVKTRFIKGEYSPAVAAASPSNPGLKATWHEFTGNRCSAIEEAPVNGTYSIEDVMIPRKVKGNIGLIIKGYFQAPQDDIYTFALLSDDGSTLTIDGEQVVDNDAPHGPKEVVGQKALSKGYHPMEVRYFDQNGGQLKLRVTGSDGQEIPFTHLYAY